MLRSGEPVRVLPVGAKVKFKDEFLSRLDEKSQRRYNGRIGVVTGYRGGASEPIVEFAKHSRFAAEKLFEVSLNRIEVVAG